MKILRRLELTKRGHGIDQNLYLASTLLKPFFFQALTAGQEKLRPVLWHITNLIDDRKWYIYYKDHKWCLSEYNWRLEWRSKLWHHIYNRRNHFCDRNMLTVQAAGVCVLVPIIIFRASNICRVALKTFYEHFWYELQKFWTWLWYRPLQTKNDRM